MNRGYKIKPNFINLLNRHKSFFYGCSFKTRSIIFVFINFELVYQLVRASKTKINWDYKNTLNTCFIRGNKVCGENMKSRSLPCTSFLFYFAVSDVTLLLLGFYNFALHHILNLVYDYLRVISRSLQNFNGIFIVMFVL